MYLNKEYPCTGQRLICIFSALVNVSLVYSLRWSTSHLYFSTLVNVSLVYSLHWLTVPWYILCAGQRLIGIFTALVNILLIYCLHWLISKFFQCLPLNT